MPSTNEKATYLAPSKVTSEQRGLKCEHLMGGSLYLNLYVSSKQAC